MKLLPIIIAIILAVLLFSEKAYSQTRRGEPMLDMRIERVMGRNANLSAIPLAIADNSSTLSEKYFPDDIAFNIGKLELREEGRQMLNHFIIKIDDDLRKIREQHPNEPLLLKIKIAQNTKTFTAHRTRVIYSYLMERLVQAGNVQIQKEIVRESSQVNQLSCAISLSNFAENQR